MSARRRLRLVYGVTLAYFTVFGLFLAALQRYVTEDLGGGEGSVGVAVGSFALSALLLRPLLGRQVDRIGRRPFLVGALASLTIVALAFWVARSPAAVVALRLLQGAGHAALYITLASMVVDLSPQHRRATEVSRFSLFLYAGLGLGPPLAEWLMQRVPFTAIWAIAGGILGGALLVAVLLPETRDSEVEVVPPTHSLLLPGVTGPGLILLFPAIGYASIVGFASLYAETLGIGDSSGILYGGFAMTVIAVRLVAGNLADRFGSVAVTLPGLGMCVAGLLSLGLVPSAVGAVAGVILFGAGFALIFPALLTVAVDGVHDGQRAEAVGSFTVFADLGMGAGAYVMGSVISLVGYGAAFSSAAAGCLFSVALCARLPRS